MPYAIASDYAEFLGIADDYDDAERARINAGLLIAQDDVDSLIYFSRYDGTDAATITALTRATCARFQYAESTGDDGTGGSGRWTAAGIGTVRLSRGESAAANANRSADELAELYGRRTVTILSNAGLLGSAVFHT